MENKTTPPEIETVTVTMSRATAEAVKRACEEHLRFRMGQFGDFANEVCLWKYMDEFEKTCHTDEERKRFNAENNAEFMECIRHRNRMRWGMESLWKENVPSAPIDTSMRDAYRVETVWQVLRYALAWHDFPEGGMWVDFYEPLNRSDQPLPKVELKLKDEQPEEVSKGYPEKCAECGRC